MQRQYLLTRFNLRLYKRNKFLQPVSDEPWLEERFALFERYCLPSIEAQTNKDFRWFVLFDSETPERFKNRVAAYRERCPQFSPVWVKPKASWRFTSIFQQLVFRDLAELEKAAVFPDKIVTTYLDNDDALSLDHMERVAQEAESVSARTFLTFHYGIQFFEDMNLANCIYYYNNHFQTLVEPYQKGDGLYTCYGFGGHASLYKYDASQVAIREIVTPDRPAWVEVVHGKNVGNDVRVTLKLRLLRDRDALRKIANIDHRLGKYSRLKFHTTFALRFLREAGRRVVLHYFYRQYDKARVILPEEVRERGEK